MIDLISLLLKTPQAAWGLLVSLGSMIFYWFIRKEAKAEMNRDLLKENLKNVSENAQTVTRNTHKQAEIAARPAPARDDVHDWLRSLSHTDKK